MIATCLIILGQITPSRLQVWSYTSGRLEQQAREASVSWRNLGLESKKGGFAAMDRGDLNGDGHEETLLLKDGQAKILLSGTPLWASPEGWEVRQAALTDLNRDGRPEAALLVWRAFQPWPVDRVLPHGGRIAGFHDAAGRSCHLILIGARPGRSGERLAELWAGSALVDPLVAFAAVDLDGDGRQELAVLEGRYTDPPGSPAWALSVWEWNGFGFTLLARQAGNFQSLGVAEKEGRLLVTRRQGGG